MKTVHVDASAGASGDMILGALVDAGVPAAHLRRCLASLPIEGEFRPAAGTECRIGMVAAPEKPSDIHREWGTIASWFGIDGIVDELDPCPDDSDCDDDGVIDGPRLGSEDLNGNGVFEPQFGETDLTNPDTDGDGELDGTEEGLTEPETIPGGQGGTDLAAGPAPRGPDCCAHGW